MYACVYLHVYVYMYLCVRAHASVSVGVITAGDVISERSRHEESCVSLQQAKPAFHI